MSNYEYFAEVQSEAQKQRRGDFWLINSLREEAGDEVIFWSLKSCCCCCCCLFGTCSLQSSAFLLQCQGEAKYFEGRWAQWSSKTWPQSWCWGKNTFSFNTTHAVKHTSWANCLVVRQVIKKSQCSHIFGLVFGSLYKKARKSTCISLEQFSCTRSLLWFFIFYWCFYALLVYFIGTWEVFF